MPSAPSGATDTGDIRGSIRSPEGAEGMMHQSSLAHDVVSRLAAQVDWDAALLLGVRIRQDWLDLLTDIHIQ